MTPVTCHPDKPHFALGLCQTCYKRADYHKNREHILEYKRQYYRKTHTEYRNYQRDYRASRPDMHYSWWVKHRYGLSFDQYKVMLSAQDGKCKICGRVNKLHRLHTDHDHITGRVRGLLCTKCNTSIPWFVENKEQIELYLADKNFDGRKLPCT